MSPLEVVLVFTVFVFIVILCGAFSAYGELSREILKEKDLNSRLKDTNKRLFLKVENLQIDLDDTYECDEEIKELEDRLARKSVGLYRMSKWLEEGRLILDEAFPPEFDVATGTKE